MGKSYYVVNPLSDSRWDELVAQHPQASAFHERGWIEALAHTYAYEPLVVTSAPPAAPMQDGVVFCRVSSWITGSRLVSLPFSDHCAPLVSDPEELEGLIQQVRLESNRLRCRYVELRPLSPIGPAAELHESASYHHHVLDLRPSLELIFSRLHRDSIQRKIRRGEREQLAFEESRSKRALDDFYNLLLRTRRRHQLVPQPRAWFQDLLASLGEKTQIRLARKDGRPVAAMLTLRHGTSVVYKYGCSDEREHPLGGMPCLFWRLIEESKSWGAEQLDFGRSDLGQESLVTFKERFGATRQALRYYRSGPVETEGTVRAWAKRASQRVLPVLPDSLLEAVGSGLYRHIG